MRLYVEMTLTMDLHFRTALSSGELKHFAMELEFVARTNSSMILDTHMHMCACNASRNVVPVLISEAVVVLLEG